MPHRIIYTADLHGNEIQYQKLMDYAIKISADSIIIGGDIGPKESSSRYLEKQREFIKRKLPELLRPLKNKIPHSKLFLMMGNDDCAANLDVLDENDPECYRVIHNKRINLANGFEIVGYSYVPITPFGLKDWEKFDLSKVPEEIKEEYEKRKVTNYRLNGHKTNEKGWCEFNFTDNIEKEDSIQRDLREILFTKNPEKTIYILHSPPNRTNLDQITGRNHVGSFAIRQFIEEYQPYLTLHGHIHETVDISGKFKDHIGKTICLSSGNNNESHNLAVLVFDLDDLNSIKRLMI